MFERNLSALASTLLALALAVASCTGDSGRGGTGPDAPDTVDAAEDGEVEVVATLGPLPLIVTDGDALRATQEGDLLSLLTIDAGGTVCLSNPWNQDCVARVRLLDLSDGSPVYSSTDAYATSLPLLEDSILFWTGADNRLRYHEVGGPGIEQPLSEDPDFWGIQGPVLVRDGGIHWYAYDYEHSTYAFHRYDLSSRSVTTLRTAQHDWPWFLSDLGAPLSPQFDVSDDQVVWLHYQAYGDTWHYRILRGTPGGEDIPTELPTGDVNCLWPRLRGAWVYYVWYAQDEWECSQFQCFYHLARIHLESGEVEQLDDAQAQVTGLHPPLLWEGGVGWIDYREGTYRVVLRPDGGEVVTVTPPERPVGLFSGVNLVPLDDGRLRVLWSTLFDGRLQIFAEDWEF